MVSTTSDVVTSNTSASSSGEGSRSSALLKFRKGLRYFVKRANSVQWQANNSGLLGKGLQNRLTDPPNSVRNELETPGFIKSLRSLDKSQVSFIDEITQVRGPDFDTVLLPIQQISN
jgi:hypothetical protein